MNFTYNLFKEGTLLNNLLDSLVIKLNDRSL